MDGNMKKLITAVVLAGTACVAHAQSSNIWMTNTGSRVHPASIFLRICTYRAVASNFTVDSVVEGFCPMSIQYDPLTNRWREG
jgi:hypothetical protein